MRSPGNAQKPQIWPVSLSQNSTKITKINRPWPRTQFWRWSRYISVQNFRPFPPWQVYNFRIQYTVAEALSMKIDYYKFKTIYFSPIVYTYVWDSSAYITVYFTISISFSIDCFNLKQYTTVLHILQLYIWCFNHKNMNVPLFKNAYFPLNIIKLLWGSKLINWDFFYRLDIVFDAYFKLKQVALIQVICSPLI